MTALPPFNPPLPDRLYVSQFTAPHLGLMIHVAGELADADALPEGTWIAFDGTIVQDHITSTHESTGTYAINVPSTLTDTAGYFSLQWDYHVASVAQTYVTFIEVGYPSPDYESLSQELQDVVESVWMRIADIFDSPAGGPHLQTYVQAHFGRNRLAQLLRAGIRRMNIIAQPHQSYDEANFPDQQWGGLLEQITYVEVIKHLRRSYVELPDTTGVSVSHFERRDYLQRWGEILVDELALLKTMEDVFKIAAMNLGRPRVLVSGGVYGNYGPTRLPANASSRPRYWSRFY